MIEIDNSEGGGQWLRTALTLSTVLGKSFKMSNIRGSRDNPGLRPQHLKGLNATAELCNADVSGNKLKNREIEFRPHTIEGGDLNVEIETAGSIGLLFQTLQIPLSHSSTSLKIHVDGGSTFSKWSPPVPYIQNILLPIGKKLGYKAGIDVKKHGFYPKGGAEVEMEVEPQEEFKPITLTDMDKVNSIGGISIASKHLKKSDVAKRQAETVGKYLSKRGYDSDINYEYVEATCPGSGVVLWCDCENTVLGADSIGERGKPSEEVGREAAKELIGSIESDAPLDKYMSDQILNFMALATENGPSRIKVEEVTEHCKTNLSIIKKFLPIEYTIENKEIEIRRK